MNQIPRDVLDHSSTQPKVLSRSNSLMPNSTSSVNSALHDSEGEESNGCSDNESDNGNSNSVGSPVPPSTPSSVFTSPNYEDEVDAYTNHGIIEK